MKIRVVSHLFWALLIVVATVLSAGAWTKQGFVFCDANTNGVIDTGDVPVEGVLVVVENTSGTFSNAVVTDVNGFFSLALRDVPDQYVDFLFPASLPAGTTSVSPLLGSFTTDFNTEVITNSFLIENPNCAPSQQRACWLTGGGTIKEGKGQPLFTFGGNVNPGCSPVAGLGGNWNVIAHSLNLHFQGTAIDVIDCGNIEGVPPGSTSPVTPFNFIDFEGTGVVKGVGGNQIETIPVLFTARAEDLGEPGAGVDRLYLKVFTSTGTTLILISGTPGSPTTISPIPISTGNLQLHISSCP